MYHGEAYRVPPFTTYEEWIQYLIWQMNHDSDNVIVFDGPEGSGKSTAAQRLAKRIEEANGNVYDPEVQTIFTFEDFEAVWDPNMRKRVFVFDEGMNMFFSREAMQGNQKKIIKLFSQIRQCNHTLIICLPNFHWIDKYLRESRVHFRLYTYKRGGWERGYAGLQWRVWIPSAIESWMEDLHWILTFEPFPENDVFWLAYLRRKHDAFQHGFAAVPIPPMKQRETISRISPGLDSSHAREDSAPGLAGWSQLPEN